MLDDMNICGFVPDTQGEYMLAVKRLTIFLRRYPDSATAEELSAFQLHLTETDVQAPTINATVPGGGLSIDHGRWISCKLNFLLPVRVRSVEAVPWLMLEKLLVAQKADTLQLLRSRAHLVDAKAITALLAPLRNKSRFVQAKLPFAGPEGCARQSVVLSPPRRHLETAV